jgi:hypothetical protein
MVPRPVPPASGGISPQGRTLIRSLMTLTLMAFR